MEIQEAMEFIKSTQKFGSNLGLARMEQMMERLGHPERDIRAIHVAGTNGKGSVSAILCEALMLQGFRVGLYISPFIEKFNERIQINRENISDEDLAIFTGKVEQVVRDCVAEGMEHPTEFEIITAVMFLYFQAEKPDYCVIEVGLGGDRDSTNVLDPVLSVIASISFDHMNVLGNTLGEIASAKAGIIKQAPTVSYPQQPEAEIVLRRRAEETDSRLIFTDRRDAAFLGFNAEKGTQRVSYRTPNWSFEAELRLLGLHQIMNSLLAVTALDLLNVQDGLGMTPESIAEALRTVRWMGRFEILNRDPLVIIDGAHNPDGIDQLKKSLEFYWPGRKYVLVLGLLADKDIHLMADAIARDASSVICVTPHSDRGSLAKDLYEYLKDFNDDVSWEDDYSKAFERALRQCGKDEYIICSGSLYMIGDMRGVIRNRFGLPYEQ